MDLQKFIVSNQTEKFSSIQRVNILLTAFLVIIKYHEMLNWSSAAERFNMRSGTPAWLT